MRRFSKDTLTKDPPTRAGENVRFPSLGRCRRQAIFLCRLCPCCSRDGGARGARLGIDSRVVAGLVGTIDGLLDLTQDILLDSTTHNSIPKFSILLLLQSR